jgi:ribose transport system permease protein
MRRALHFLRPGNMAAVYIWLAVIVVFGIWKPDQFLTWTEAKIVLNQNAVPAIVALSLVLPLSSRSFDLSVGNMTGLAAVFVAWLLVNKGVALVPALLITLLVALGIGTLNALVVVVIGVDSFITTLAVGALMGATVIGLTGEQAIVGTQLSGTFTEIGSHELLGLTLPFWIMIALGVVLIALMDHTSTGRRLYATGYNERAALLAGVRTKRLRFVALLASAGIAGIAGILIAAQTSSGSPSVGPNYLLGAFAAAFLGSSQFREGLFNAPGTIVAVLMLGTGQAGLALVGAPTWTPDMFTGVVLLLALIGTRAESLRAYRQRLAKQREAGAATP